MITVQKISKFYGEVPALKEISFEVQEGEIFGLIGPDGAGKTSLFRILTTLQRPDSGAASVAGYDVIQDYRQIRNIVGYMPGRFSLYEDLSVQENLEFFATIFGTTIAENYNIIEDIYQQLAPFKNREAGALSGGMKQKLALSCALIHKPDVLLLDEPTTGVDPVSREELWESLRALEEANITILVSTPFMEEAALCDRIALINKGEILDINTPEGIRQSFKKKLYAIKTNSDMFTLLKDLNRYEYTESAWAFGAVVHYTDKRSDNAIEADLTHYLQKEGHQSVEVSPISPSIENTFMSYMTQNQ